MKKSKATKPISKVVANVTTPRPSNLSEAMGCRRAREPVLSDDPLAELRRLVGLHKRWTNVARSWKGSVSDRTNHETGETIQCTVPLHIRTDLKDAAKMLQAEASRLETAMKAQLKLVPIYAHFLKRVFGMGPVVAAYLVSMIRIERCPNVSNLIRYCGNACGPNGKREGREGGAKYGPDGELTKNGTGTYNDELKMRLYQFFMFMRMNASKTDSTTKYLTRWSEAKHTALTIAGTTQGFADAKGRRKATDLFLWDYYVIARALAGLPIRPDKFSAVRGRWHNGEEARDALYTLTLEEALAMVGDAGKRPLSESAAAE
jgi:hypothetical protein